VEYAEGQEVFEDALVKKLQAEASAGARNSLSVVPEPATSSTAAVGLLALVLRRRRVATGK
jgi:MYXO-CTERM domain-containing protein